MTVYISADIEGISGVVSPNHGNENYKDYERFRRLMTLEVNAAVAGAADGGADAVVVNDSHGRMSNILIEELDVRAELISGSPKPLGMMQGVEDSVDLAFLIGYHAASGTASAVLDHTTNGTVHQVRLNGEPLGEAGMNAYMAAAAERATRRGRREPIALPKRKLELEVTFQRTSQADMAELIPGAVRVNGRTVSWTGDGMKEVYRTYEAMTTLAAAG